MEEQFLLPSPIQEVTLPFLVDNNIKLYIKRDDLIHKNVSGNKWRKLKGYLYEGEKQTTKNVLTFGGAFSNHLVATAAACHFLGLKSFGVVRGEIDPNNPTLLKCQEFGMVLHAVSRSEYKIKERSKSIADLITNEMPLIIIPEGGAGVRALSGVHEMMDELTTQMVENIDYIAIAAGTGTSCAGILSYPYLKSKVVCFSVLKSTQIYSDIAQLVNADQLSNLCMDNGHHFGGYAKWNQELIDFIQDFYRATNMLLDPVYTGKAMYGLFEQIRVGQIPQHSTVVFIHTGGIQGWNGFEYRYGVRVG